MGEEVKDIYQKISERHELPDYKMIDKELEISSLEPDKFILRRIRHRIKDRIEKYCEIIEDLLHPDTTIANMHECSFLNDRTKTRIFILYKKLMYMLRTSDLLDVERDMKKEAKYINNYFSYKESIKKEMKHIVDLRRNSWKKELAENIKAEYFG